MGRKLSKYFLALLVILGAFSACASILHVKLNPGLPKMKAAKIPAKIVLLPVENKRTRNWPVEAVAMWQGKAPFLLDRPVADFVADLIHRTLEKGDFVVVPPDAEGAEALPRLKVRLDDFGVDIEPGYHHYSYDGQLEMRLELSSAGKVLAAKNVEGHQKRNAHLLTEKACETVANEVLEAALNEAADFIESGDFAGAFARK